MEHSSVACWPHGPSQHLSSFLKDGKGTREAKFLRTFSGRACGSLQMDSEVEPEKMKDPWHWQPTWPLAVQRLSFAPNCFTNGQRITTLLSITKSPEEPWLGMTSRLVLWNKVLCKWINYRNGVKAGLYGAFIRSESLAPGEWMGFAVGCASISETAQSG